MVQNLAGHSEDFEVYSKYSRHPLEGIRQKLMELDLLQKEHQVEFPKGRLFPHRGVPFLLGKLFHR